MQKKTFSLSSCIIYDIIFKNKNLYFKHYFSHRVPDDDTVKYGSLKNNGENCMDTMGHQLNEGVGVFNCHGQGGNQVGRGLSWRGIWCYTGSIVQQNKITYCVSILFGQTLNVAGCRGAY